MNKLKTKFKDFMMFLLGVIFTTCVTVLAETCSTTLSSGNITYGNTTAEAEVTSLLTQAGNLNTRVGNLESRFINNATSYFNGDDLHVGANNTTGSSRIQLYGTNGTLRGTLMYDAEDDKTYLAARAASGAWASGTLDLRGASVMVNGTNIGKRPVSISSQQTFTSSTTLAYTGKSIQIPANCYFVITVNVLYVNSKPSAAYLSTSSSTLAGTAWASGSSGNASHVTLTYSGTTTNSNLTLYVWAQYASAASNRVDFSGFYIPQ